MKTEFLFYICFADLNNLKPVNDNLGHDAGDRYLAAVAHALEEAAGERMILSAGTAVMNFY